MNGAELSREVESVVVERTSTGETAPMTWIVKEIIDRHGSIAGDDLWFYRLCAYEHVRKVVRDYMRNERTREQEPENDRQMVLSGYKRAQLRYPIERDGEQTIVRLEDMTADEVREKAMYLKAIAIGANAHAEELLHYLSKRGAASSSSVG